MARKINTRETRRPKKRVVGAGITEFWYLKHLKPLLELDFENINMIINSCEKDEILKILKKPFLKTYPCVKSFRDLWIPFAIFPA